MPRDRWKNARLPSKEQIKAKFENDEEYYPPHCTVYKIKKIVEKLSSWKVVQPNAKKKAEEFFESIQWGAIERDAYSELLLGCAHENELIRTLCQKTLTRLSQDIPPDGQRFRQEYSEAFDPPE